MKYKLVYILLILTFLQIDLHAQGSEESKFNLAKSYENSGSFENAARIYKQLYDNRPGLDKYFDAVVRTCKAQKKFEELKQIVEHRLTIVQNPKTYALLGEMYWRLGKVDSAKKAWQTALEKFPDDPDRFQIAAETQQNIPVLEMAIETLKEGRDELGEPNMFSDRLSRLYIATGNYKAGVEEILNYLKQSRNIANAQGHLYALMTNDKANEYIGQKLKKAASKHERDLRIQQLYLFYLRTIKEYDEALQVTIRLDELTKSNGKKISQFAYQSRRDGQYDTALKAYSYLIDKREYKKYLPSSLYGYARTLENKLAVKQEISKDEIKTIIDRYEKIIDEYPNQQNSAESRYRIAVLANDYLNNHKRAIEELTMLIENYPRTEVTAKGINYLASVYASRDKLEKAREIYRKVVRTFKNVSPDDHEKALYKLAELNYYQGNIDSAKAQFEKAASNSNSDVANDALDKLVMLEQNKKLTKALKVYAKADLKNFQGDYTEAIKLYKEAYELSTGENLAQKSMVKIAEIEFERTNYNAVKDYMNTLLEENPESIYADYALVLIARSYLQQSDEQAAIKKYNELLINHPRSIYLQEARKKIRGLRNEKS